MFFYKTFFTSQAFFYVAISRYTRQRGDETKENNKLNCFAFSDALPHPHVCMWSHLGLLVNENCLWSEKLTSCDIRRDTEGIVFIYSKNTLENEIRVLARAHSHRLSLTHPPLMSVMQNKKQLCVGQPAARFTWLIVSENCNFQHILCN